MDYYQHKRKTPQGMSAVSDQARNGQTIGTGVAQEVHRAKKHRCPGNVDCEALPHFVGCGEDLSNRALQSNQCCGECANYKSYATARVSLAIRLHNPCATKRYPG